MAGRLSDSDVRVLRGVLDDPDASSRSIPTALRKPVAEKVGAGRIRLRIRSGGPADAVPPEIADEVLAPGWVERPSRYPAERVFEGPPSA